jgi:NHL repeat-containing protein
MTPTRSCGPRGQRRLPIAATLVASMAIVGCTPAVSSAPGRSAVASSASGGLPNELVTAPPATATAAPTLRPGTAGRIVTVAGGGSDAGDGEPATSAMLRLPVDVALGPTGDLYIAEAGEYPTGEGGSRIRRVKADGTIDTIAGTGRPGFSGDGGPAVNAELNQPSSIAFGPAGDLFIADRQNERIRRVDQHGIITTFAGTGIKGFSGDGGPARAAALATPYGIAFDSGGDLFIADSDNNRIRRVDRNGIITTIAGTGEARAFGDGGPARTAGVNDPYDVVVDRDGNLYEVDANRIRRIDHGGVITAFAGTEDGSVSGGDGGPATAATFNAPVAIGTDASGRIYIADHHGNRIRVITPDGHIATAAGTGHRGSRGDGGLATDADLNQPWGSVGDTTYLYFADTFNNRVRAIRVG